MRSISLFFVCLTLVLPYAAVAQSLEFDLLDTAPRAVTHPYGNIAVQSLPNGKLIVWDGDAIHVQQILGGNQFSKVASGYLGDTGFMAVSPDGHTLVLGAGMSGRLYRFDLNAPADYSAAADLGVVSHYWGVFLTNTLLLLDKLTDDYATDELAVIDISAPTLNRKTVMLKPPAAEIPAGGFVASAALAVDRTRTNVYAMALAFDGSFSVVANPLKRILVSDILTAYNASQVLDWNTNAVAIGGETAFSSGGPVGVTNEGKVLISGFGGLDLIDPATASILATYDPAGMVYYGGVYNAATGDIIPIATDTAEYTMDLIYMPRGSAQPMPLTGIAGLGILSMLLALRAAKRMK